MTGLHNNFPFRYSNLTYNFNQYIVYKIPCSCPAASDNTRQSRRDGRKFRTNPLTVPTFKSIPPVSLEEVFIHPIFDGGAWDSQFSKYEIKKKIIFTGIVYEEN